MSGNSDRDVDFLEWAQKGYYRRERQNNMFGFAGRDPLGLPRTFGGALVTPPGRYLLPPDLEPWVLEPRREDRVLPHEKRLGVTDTFQGTYGYFFGGGWTFGLVENRNLRATADSVSRYLQRNTAGTFPVEFTYGDPSGLLRGTHDVTNGMPADPFDDFFLSAPPATGYYLIRVQVEIGGSGDTNSGRPRIPLFRAQPKIKVSDFSGL
jgi:hypothetical protein